LTIAWQQAIERTVRKRAVYRDSTLPDALEMAEQIDV
jgi:hypothetical protein